jgi:hypothetical protein
MSMPENKCCCCSDEKLSVEKGTVGFPKWGDDFVGTPRGNVSVVPSMLTFQDKFGSWKARWGIGRMQFRVEPGLYAVGNPTADSPVLVSANYKMSFDVLRSSISGLSAWILVLDTKGVNVWCAAGKKTFGTDELVRRATETALHDIVSHRTLVVPQLGAVGVCSQEVAKQSGFQVAFGPVRAGDIPRFLESKMQATPEMRQIGFSTWDRAVLIPVELVPMLKYLLLAAIVIFFLSGLPATILSLLLAAFGIVLGPILLPWLPGRSFWFKGACLGGLLSLIPVGVQLLSPGIIGGWTSTVAWCFVLPALISFTLMNFTGCTTFTSFSGVNYEMRRGIPFQILAGLAGIILLIVGGFL